MKKEESNKLISEFMGNNFLHENGLSVFILEHEYFDPISDSYISFFNPNEMRYDQSWDWLMPVREKIDSLGYAFNINSDAVRILNYNSDIKNYNNAELIAFHSILNTDVETIKAVYWCVIDFIQNYNQQPK